MFRSAGADARLEFRGFASNCISNRSLETRGNFTACWKCESVQREEQLRDRRGYNRRIYRVNAERDWTG